MVYRYMRAVIKIINIMFYCLVYGKSCRINFLKSYFSGTVNIESGSLKINDGLRNKSFLNISVKYGSLEIGRNCFFNNFCSINCREKISIGHNCLFGENVLIYDHDHAFYDPDKLIRDQGFKTKEIKIGNNVWVGSSVVILKGISIGDNSIIAAGSILTKDVPSNTIYRSQIRSQYVSLVNTN